MECRAHPRLGLYANVTAVRPGGSKAAVAVDDHHLHVAPLGALAVALDAYPGGRPVEAPQVVHHVGIVRRLFPARLLEVGDQVGRRRNRSAGQEGQGDQQGEGANA